MGNDIKTNNSPEPTTEVHNTSGSEGECGSCNLPKVTWIQSLCLGCSLQICSRTASSPMALLLTARGGSPAPLKWISFLLGFFFVVLPQIPLQPVLIVGALPFLALVSFTNGDDCSKKVTYLVAGQRVSFGIILP